MKYLISACLVGHPVRYDGQHCLQQKIKTLIDTDQAVVICPEISGGLSTPRAPAEIQKGTGSDVLSGHAKVFDLSGKDVTEAFILGAKQTLAFAKKHGITHAILKAKSPSCGFGQIYDGSFSGTKINANGVTAALLKQHGIHIMTEKEFLGQLTKIESAT